MSFTYRIDKANGVVLIVWDGVLDSEMLGGLQNTLRGDPEFAPTFSVLSDLRKIARTTLTSGDVRRLANDSPFDGTGRRAFVVDNDIMHGISRMYQAYLHEGGDRAKRFRDIAEARKWLGLPEA